VLVPHPGNELMAVAAVVLEEPAFASQKQLPGMWPVTILGKRSRRVYEALARAPQGGAAPRALRRTGYYVLPGEDGDVMILDAAGSGNGRTGASPSNRWVASCSSSARGPAAGGPLLLGARRSRRQRSSTARSRRLQTRRGDPDVY
jgi:hypothetical protein